MLVGQGIDWASNGFSVHVSTTHLVAFDSITLIVALCNDGVTVLRNDTPAGTRMGPAGSAVVTVSEVRSGGYAEQRELSLDVLAGIGELESLDFQERPAEL